MERTVGTGDGARVFFGTKDGANTKQQEDQQTRDTRKNKENSVGEEKGKVPTRPRKMVKGVEQRNIVAGVVQRGSN